MNKLTRISWLDEKWKAELAHSNKGLHGVNIVWYQGGNKNYEKNFFKSRDWPGLAAILHCIRFNIDSHKFKIRTNN